MILIYSSDIDEVILVAHGVSCGRQSGTVIVEILNLDGYCPSGSFGRDLCKTGENVNNFYLFCTLLDARDKLSQKLTIGVARNYDRVCSIDQVLGFSVRKFPQPDISCPFINNQPVVNVLKFGIPFKYKIHIFRDNIQKDTVSKHKVVQ